MHHTSSKPGRARTRTSDTIAVRPLLARSDGVAGDRPRGQVLAALLASGGVVVEDGVVVTGVTVDDVVTGGPW